MAEGTICTTLAPILLPNKGTWLAKADPVPCRTGTPDPQALGQVEHRSLTLVCILLKCEWRIRLGQLLLVRRGRAVDSFEGVAWKSSRDTGQDLAARSCMNSSSDKLLCAGISTNVFFTRYPIFSASLSASGPERTFLGGCKGSADTAGSCGTSRLIRKASGEMLCTAG